MSRGAMALAVIVVAGGCSRGPAVRFTGAGQVGTATPVGTAPMFAVSASGTQALAWVSAPDSGTDGRLYVSVAGAAAVELRDPLGPVEPHGESPPKLAYGPDGALNAIYAVARLAAGKRYGVAALRYVRSTDGGTTWSRPVTVTDDEAFGRRHNFHALHAAADGSLYISWLDDRDGKAAPYLTRSRDGGKTWEPNRRVGTGEACPCCRTAIATTPDGTLFVAWRAILPGDVRDIVVARSSDGGVTWTQPTRVHADDWVYPGCPHAGPSIQVDRSNQLHVVWWVGKDGAAGVYYARSPDGGSTFTPPVAMGVAMYSKPAHVQMVLGSRGEVVVAWDDGTTEVPRVVVRISRDGGRSFGPSEPASAPDRAAQFPVLALTDSTVTLAWSEQSASTAKAEQEMKATMPKGVPMGLKAVGNAQVVVRSGRIL